MNVSFNTNSLNTYKQNSYSLNQSKAKQFKSQSFTANTAKLADAAEQVVEQAAKDKSGFFKPFSNFL